MNQEMYIKWSVYLDHIPKNELTEQVITEIKGNVNEVINEAIQNDLKSGEILTSVTTESKNKEYEIYDILGRFQIEYSTKN